MMAQKSESMSAENVTRCPWPTKPLDIHYHDTEWGVPLHDDRRLFEMLILEGAQAGLSWSTILAKRENYREACDGFATCELHRDNAATPLNVVLTSCIGKDCNPPALGADRHVIGMFHPILFAVGSLDPETAQTAPCASIYEFRRSWFSFTQNSDHMPRRFRMLTSHPLPLCPRRHARHPLPRH